jgi:two-component system, NtrC family, nitrogen regulation sensor histidine kinase NtrY
LVFRFNKAKERDNRLFLIETLANKLAGEQDAVAEMYMTQSERKIATDPNILDMLGNGTFYEEELHQYLVKNYFIGYLSRYETQVVPCWPKAELVVAGAAQTFDCYSYFADMVSKLGDPVEGSDHFHFMKKDNGRINYFGVFKFFEDLPGLETSIFIEFTSKPFFEGLGYPELLVSDKERAQFELLKDYSYAKYVDGRLAKRSGDYLYRVTSSRFDKTAPGQKSFVYANRFSHLVYSPRQGTQIVMSYPSIGLSNVLMAFSVIYILFLTASFVILFLSRIGHQSAYSRYSIRERIQISLVAFSMVLLLAIGGSSVMYAVYQYKSKNNAMLSQRLKSVMMEMDQKVGAEKRLNDDMAEYLNYLLQTFSNVFYTDINLYGLSGKLLATSRPELYQKGVMGDYMNPLAFKALSVDGEREFIHNESIGSLSYISAYVPFLNQKNEVLAYLNIPYFVGQDELREEVSSIMVAMINAYLVFVLVAIGVAFWVSRQITRPLLVLQQRLSQTRLGLKNEKIQYSRPDEIGHLVDEYNRMVDELAQSADKLAKSERELAWREMAKQIAHEIKNPLTPMQLSVQYLQKAWDDKVPDFDKFIRRVTQTLIDHIRQLSVIATEFSHFAKMPSAKIERIDIVEKLLNTIALYEKSTDARFEHDLGHQQAIYVEMDREQLLSVFNNLIKNALQSVASGTKPTVGLSLRTEGRVVVFSVSDNGKGISDDIKSHLFTPNFTTKTSGMGLGLAITKNIVEGAGGKISFETTVGEGSTFYVSLPLVS